MMQAYPLQWPPTWKREGCREYSRFGDCTIASEKNSILHELDLMGASEIIISSDLKIKIDGFPYSNQRQPDDRGVAVYFKLKGKSQCIPCDRWSCIQDNMRAIAKTVGALRGIGRWGADQMVDAAFTGFKALPEGNGHWWDILGVSVNATFEQVERAYKELAFEHHPDREGGDHQKMSEINSAMETARIAAQA